MAGFEVSVYGRFWVSTEVKFAEALALMIEAVVELVRPIARPDPPALPPRPEPTARPSPGQLEYITVREAAERMRISQKTVYRLLQEGTLLEGMQIGRQWRIRSDSVDRQLSSRGSRAERS